MNKTFKDAYDLAFVEGDAAGAIEICRKLLEAEPGHHNARMLLGCLLSDSPDPQQRELGRQHFLIAIKHWSSLAKHRSLWLEENPYYQIALWERKNGSVQGAAVLFAIDYVLHQTEGSREQLYTLIEEELPNTEKQRIIETLDIIWPSIGKTACINS